MVLNIKDKQILYYLDYNARQSISSIAKQVGLSKQVVHYRLEKIFKEHLIKKCLTILDLSQLGFILHKAYFRFQNTSVEKEKEIINFLTKHKNVSWLVSCEGRFDLAVAFHTENVVQLDKTLTEIENKYGIYFAERVVNTVINTNFFMRDYLVKENKKCLRQIPSFQTVPKKQSLDKKDYLILAALAQDSRIEIRKIASIVQLTEDAVRKRIKGLEAKEIIKNYIIVPNSQALGIHHYKILIHLHNYNNQKEKNFIQFCQNNPQISFMNKNIGAWEMEIDMEVDSEEMYREVMREFKKEFSDIIKDYYALTIYKVHKFNFLPSYEEIIMKQRLK